MKKCMACVQRIYFWQRSMQVENVGHFHPQCRQTWLRLTALFEAHHDRLAKERSLPTLKQLAAMPPMKSKNKPLEM